MGRGRRGDAVWTVGVLIIDFLKTAELFGPWVADCPLAYRSNHAPKKADVLGTLFLSVLAGHCRYAPITPRLPRLAPRADVTVRDGGLLLDKIEAENLGLWVSTDVFRLNTTWYQAVDPVITFSARGSWT